MSYSYTVGDIPGRDYITLIEIGGGAPVAVADGAPWQVGVAPVGMSVAPNAIGATPPTFRFASAPWIGEPTDAERPNQNFLPRLAAPVAISESIDPRPGGVRGTISLGEVTLHNLDGRMAELGGDWSNSGRPVIIRRIAKRRGQSAPFSTATLLASLRTAGSFFGGDKLSVPLEGAQADLSVPACNVYDGTGGTGGTAAMIGKFKQRLFGQCANVEPELLDAALLIYQLHDGSMAGITALRDMGVLLTFGGNLATYADLVAYAAPPSGFYYTCVAAGVFRLGALPVGRLTADCTGDSAAGTGGYVNTLAGIARKCIEGIAGVSGAGWVSAGFATWPVGAVGIGLKGGTVADALDRLAGAAAGWWGTDTQGRFVAGVVVDPETVTPTGTFRLLAARPRQAQPMPPIWRIRCAHDVLDAAQTEADLAATVSATDRARYAEQFRLATAFSGAVQVNVPKAVDPAPVASLFVAQADAQAMANRLLALHSPGRVAWDIDLGRVETTVAIGQVWRVDSKLAPRLANKNWLVIGRDIRGERMTVTLWG